MNKIKTILVVDDSESDHVIVNFAIEDFGDSIKVLKAYDGQEALDILQQCKEPPEVILLDINMPGMNGLEFLAEYSKKRAPSTVVAMLTSSDQESDKEICMNYSFVRKYIVKPLEAEDLKEIESIL